MLGSLSSFVRDREFANRDRRRPAAAVDPVGAAVAAGAVTGQPVHQQFSNMAAQLNVRPATVADATAIAAVAREAWAVGYKGLIQVDVQEEYLASGYAVAAVEQAVVATDGYFLVACTGVDEQHEIVGFTQLQDQELEPESSPEGPVHAHLHRLYIRPAVQKRGVGKALLQAGLAAIRAANHRPNASNTQPVVLSCAVRLEA